MKQTQNAQVELFYSHIALASRTTEARQVLGPLQLLTPKLLPLLPLLPHYVFHGLTLALLVYLAQLVAALLELPLLLSAVAVHLQHSVLILALPYVLSTLPQVLSPDLILAALVGTWVLGFDLHSGYGCPMGLDDKENCQKNTYCC